MARLSQDEAMVNARIVYWGVEGAGKTTNLIAIHDKLRRDHRGELERIPTRIDPSVEYEVMPIELGEIAGLRTRIQMIAVPGGADQAPTRKQLLDQVDGVVLVIDSRRERIDENVASVEELREALADYGQSIDGIPLVLQYNKRDQSDPYVIDELHRRLGVRDCAVFESVATETTGVLQTLSTLSKRVIRRLRDQQFNVAEPSTGLEATEGGTLEGAEPESDSNGTSQTRIDAPAFAGVDADPAPPVDSGADLDPDDSELDPSLDLLADLSSGEPGSEPDAVERMEQAILDEETGELSEEIEGVAHQTEVLLDAPWDQIAVDEPAEALGDEPGGAQIGPEISIDSVGQATRSGERSIRVPLVLADKAGRTSTLVLTISLDPLLDGDPD
jgi:signal recognition particle receptor subunit beta